MTPRAVARKRRATPVTSALSVRGLEKALQKKAKEVGKLRDELRNLISEYEGLVDSCDRAEASLQDAVDSLSELV